MRWRETAKKAMIMMRQTWRIGEGRFKNKFERRMKIYGSLAESVMMYAAETWGWNKSDYKVYKMDIRFGCQNTNIQ